MNIDDIGSIIGSLSGDDIEALKGVAETLFASAPQDSPKAEKEDDSAGGIDAQTIGKIASVMGMLSQGGSDPRCALLNSLKPFLKQERRHKVDEAEKMLKMIDLIPKLRSQGIL